MGTGAKMGGLIVLIFIIIFVALVWYAWNNQNDHLKRGCEPKAWNSMGLVTVWSCPVRESG